MAMLDRRAAIAAPLAALLAFPSLSMAENNDKNDFTRLKRGLYQLDVLLEQVRVRFGVRATRRVARGAAPIRLNPSG